jgi:aminopeptidase N
VAQTEQRSRVLPPTRYIPDDDFDTRHVALNIRFDWEREEIRGVETLIFKPLFSNLQTIELDAAEMTITSNKKGRRLWSSC